PLRGVGPPVNDGWRRRHQCAADGGDRLSVVAATNADARGEGPRQSCVATALNAWSASLAAENPAYGAVWSSASRSSSTVHPRFKAPRRCVLSSSVCPVAASTETTTRLRYFSSRPGRFQMPPQTLLDGGLEERPQKRIASAGCRRLAGRCTEHLLTDLWAARPCVLCRGVHRYLSFHWTHRWRIG